MAVIWPLSLPQSPLAQGYREGFGNNVIRTQMETGPAKQRRRFTAVEIPCSVPLCLDRTQVTTLRAFYQNVAAAITFTWKDFLTGAPADYRFNKEPEVGTLNAEPEIWGTTLELMRQP